jgi:small subunit ribosomal protein S6
MTDDTRIASYEGMFVFPQSQTSDLGGAADHIQGIFAKHGAELIAMKKWDERRLAYSIEKHNRGLFVLTYFKASTTALPAIERDFNLSEAVIRALITRSDHLTEEEMQAADGQADMTTEAALRSDAEPEPVAAPVAAEEPAPAAPAEEAAPAPEKPTE